MPTQNLSVLIADDNELNRWLLGEQLSQWTSNITQAAEGREAWQLLQTKAYSLIFLDVNMPFLNGFDLIAKLKSDQTPNRSTPVIAVTAHKQHLQLQALNEAGFNASLVKPILLQHLQEIMSQWLCIDSPTFYASQIAKKTGYNRDLSKTILNKLFEEVPDQLQHIAQAYRQADYQEAWQLTHKMHGSFCFYSFSDFLPDVERLEHSIRNRDDLSIDTSLSAISTRFGALLDNKSALFAAIDTEVNQDLSDTKKAR